MKKYKLKAIICSNGHIFASGLELNSDPEFKYCSKCGSPLIEKCQYCNSFIPGGERTDFETSALLAVQLNLKTQDKKVLYLDSIPPKYCPHCGKPYPWTQKFLENYQQLLDLSSDEIDENLKKIILDSTQNLLKDNFSKSSIYILILKKAFAGLSEITKAILINSMADFGGEAIKSLFG